MPSVGGFITQATFPALTSQTTMQMTTSLDPPSQVVQTSVRRQEATGALNVLYYLIFTPAVTISLPSLPSVTVTLPNSIPTAGESFFAAVSVPTTAGRNSVS